LALDMYVHRLSAGIAAMAVAAGGIDALAFTGGVGEHSAYVRERVCARLGLLGVVLAPSTDAVGDRELGAPQSAVRVTVIGAREEFAIARDVALLLAREPSFSSAP
jgi:acetate kinase